MKCLDKNDVFMVLMDIDGTLKDLAQENTSSLINAMKSMDNINLTLRGKIVLFIDRINMYLVKTGLLPTNKFMQNVLLLMYSLLLIKRYDLLKEKYFEEYNKCNVFFEDAVETLKKMNRKNEVVYLVTKNRQNKGIFKISNGVEKNIAKYIEQLLIVNEKYTKYHVFKRVIKNRGMERNEAIVIGDNFWDDVLPAMLLGVKVVWCNRYNCRIKSFAIKVLKLINHNVLTDEDVNV